MVETGGYVFTPLGRAVSRLLRSTWPPLAVCRKEGLPDAEAVVVGVAALVQVRLLFSHIVLTTVSQRLPVDAGDEPVLLPSR